MRRLTIRQALWLGFGIEVVHNLEELLTMGPFLEAHRPVLPAQLAEMTGGRFAVSLAVVTLLALAWTWAGARSGPNRPALILAVAVQIPLGLNGLQHAGVAVWAGGYAPGVASGLALCLPFAAWLLQHSLREGWVAPRPMLLVGLAATALEAPLLLAAHGLSGLFG